MFCLTFEALAKRQFVIYVERHALRFFGDVLGTTQKTESVIYVWNVTTEMFEEMQRLSTVGAYDWSHFTAEGYTFLALAQAFDGQTTQLDSRVYVLQEDQFFLFQTMEVNITSFSFSNLYSVSAVINN